MKKLIAVTCFMLLCIALFNPSVYAVWIVDIKNYQQDNDTSTPASFFEDDFADGTPPVTGADYFVETISGFPAGRENPGDSYLELDSDDAITDGDGELFVGASVANSSHFFSSTAGVAGSITGQFDFSDGGLPSGTFFGLDVFNMTPDGSGGFNDPAVDDGAWMGISRNEFGTFANWGNETSEGPLGWINISSSIIDEQIGLKLEMNGSKNVSALFNFGGGDGWEILTPNLAFPLLGSGISSGGFHTLSFSGTDIYTGGFGAGAEASPVPEPATIALLGIGLAGFGGGYLRRRRKQKQEEIT